MRQEFGPVLAVERKDAGKPLPVYYRSHRIQPAFDCLHEKVEFRFAEVLRAAALMAQDHPNMVLYHFTWLWGLGDRVSGVKPMPDGILRPAGVVVKGN